MKPQELADEFRGLSALDQVEFLESLAALGSSIDVCSEVEGWLFTLATREQFTPCEACPYMEGDWNRPDPIDEWAETLSLEVEARNARHLEVVK